MVKVGFDRSVNIRKLVIRFFLEHASGRSSEVIGYLRELKLELSAVTVKRFLTALSKEGTLFISGRGPSTEYGITVSGRLFADIDAAVYCAADPDARHGLRSYNHDLFAHLPSSVMTEDEIRGLDAVTAVYRNRIKAQTEAAHHKELERFVIELSWKSSQIEGNTYSILDTERLIGEGIRAPQHSEAEATMILNHKAAFQFVLEHRDDFRSLTRPLVEELHSILVRDLGITRNLRTGLIGVTGSSYRPLDNQFQIQEAMEALARAVAGLTTGYEKALLAVLGISYIQPFEDGNKRTARMLANAVLLAHGLSPLSYRSVDKETYREAMLVFYELNALLPFKGIFIDQYKFAAEHYVVV